MGFPYGDPIWGSHMGSHVGIPYGDPMWGSHMGIPDGNPMWDLGFGEWCPLKDFGSLGSGDGVSLRIFEVWGPGMVSA